MGYSGSTHCTHCGWYESELRINTRAQRPPKGGKPGPKCPRCGSDDVDVEFAMFIEHHCHGCGESWTVTRNG